METRLLSAVKADRMRQIIQAVQSGQKVAQDVRVDFPFIVTRVSCECETERDYDTAVDLVTSDICTIKVSFETTYGLEINLEQTTISSSHSYLEPDLVEYEQSGEVHYQTHRDADRDSTSVYCHATYALPVEVPVISRNEYAELVEKIDAGIQLPEHLDNYRFYEMEKPDNYREDEGVVGLTNDVIDAIVDISGPSSRRPVRRPITVSLPSSVAAEIRAAEARLRTRRMANFDAWLHNKVQIALFELLGKTEERAVTAR